MQQSCYLVDGDPRRSPRFLMAHGAGAPMDSAWMNRVSEGIASHGVAVIRFEFPYMQQRRKSGTRRGPDRPHVLAGAWHEAVDDWSHTAPPVIGGKSMGGRIASMVAADAEVAGVACMGYPFHPPGRPDKLRTAHLAALETPTLILQGDRDRFGTPDEVEHYDLSPAIRVRWIADGDHSFKPRVRSGRTLEQNLQVAIAAAAQFILTIS